MYYHIYINARYTVSLADAYRTPRFKIVHIGKAKVGKKALVERYICGHFVKPYTTSIGGTYVLLII